VWNGDRRLRDKYGEETFEEYAQTTSVFPFQAVWEVGAFVCRTMSCIQPWYAAQYDPYAEPYECAQLNSGFPFQAVWEVGAFVYRTMSGYTAFVCRTRSLGPHHERALRIRGLGSGVEAARA
jgi:hypothetical protein